MLNIIADVASQGWLHVRQCSESAQAQLNFSDPQTRKQTIEITNIISWICFQLFWGGGEGGRELCTQKGNFAHEYIVSVSSLCCLFEELSSHLRKVFRFKNCLWETQTELGCFAFFFASAIASSEKKARIFPMNDNAKNWWNRKFRFALEIAILYSSTESCDDDITAT